MNSKRIFLTDRVETEDKQITASHHKTEIIIKNKLGEVLFKGQNKIIIPGAAFTARAHFDIPGDEITPTYNTELGLDNSIDKPANSDVKERVFLFAVGTDGGGPEPAQKYPVDYTKWINPNSLVPFRYVEAGSDIIDRSKYFGKKSFPANEEYNLPSMNAYYFKTFDTDPVLHQKYTDGTNIINPYTDSSTRKAETYVQLLLSITEEDCRDWFALRSGISQAKINTLSLLTSWKYNTTENGIPVVYHQDIRPLTKLNIIGESLIELSKGIDITYNIYY